MRCPAIATADAMSVYAKLEQLGITLPPLAVVVFRKS